VLRDVDVRQVKLTMGELTSILSLRERRIV